MNPIVIDLTRRLSDEFKDNLIAVGVFGSYARGEERPDSDIDIFCCFQELDQEVVKHIGTVCREFFRDKDKEPEYPFCFTLSDYNDRGFRAVFGDPIKYFECKIVYGDIDIKKPSLKEVINSCHDILADPLIKIRHYLITDTDLKNMDSGKLKRILLKPIVVALKLERYVVEGNYPLTFDELKHSCEGLIYNKVLNWFSEEFQFKQDIEKDQTKVLEELMEIYYVASNNLLKKLQAEFDR